MPTSPKSVWTLLHEISILLVACAASSLSRSVTQQKAANMIALTEPPYYVLTMSVSSHGSFGGYRVNTEFQVLDTAGNPIPNLYSAGEVCSGTFIYDEYPAGGCGLNWAYTSGRFAGANAAQAVLA